MSKVTQWFDAAQEPVHPGLYEAVFFNRSKEIARHMAKWDGSKWSYKNGLRPSAMCGDKWRGLADKPEGK